MATITEKPVHGVMTPVIEMEGPAEEIDFAAKNFRAHAHRHAADGDDPLTPEMIGAVNKANGTIKDRLSIEGEAYPGIHLFDSTNGGKGFLEHHNKVTNLAVVDDANDGSNRRYIVINAKSNTDSLIHAVQFKEAVNGVYKTYDILHTGNKPSGTYTGNGSATKRTIDTGGIGAALLIIGNGASSIVTPGGAFILAGGNVSALGADYIRFSSGVLPIATNHGGLNANGIPYDYYVL